MDLNVSKVVADIASKVPVAKLECAKCGWKTYLWSTDPRSWLQVHEWLTHHIANYHREDGSHG